MMGAPNIVPLLFRVTAHAALVRITTTLVVLVDGCRDLTLAHRLEVVQYDALHAIVIMPLMVAHVGLDQPLLFFVVLGQ